MLARVLQSVHYDSMSQSLVVSIPPRQTSAGMTPAYQSVLDPDSLNLNRPPYRKAKLSRRRQSHAEARRGLHTSTPLSENRPEEKYEWHTACTSRLEDVVGMKLTEMAQYARFTGQDWEESGESQDLRKPSLQSSKPTVTPSSLLSATTWFTWRMTESKRKISAFWRVCRDRLPHRAEKESFNAWKRKLLLSRWYL